MSREDEHDWAGGVEREEVPECVRCGERSEWRDDDTGELLCDGCAR